MKYHHVDVFTYSPMKGNGLTVVFPEDDLNYKALLGITREFKQFETIFVYPQKSDGSFPVRIFTVDEELNFAGHPILGAAAVLHNIFYGNQNRIDIRFILPEKEVEASSLLSDSGYTVTMNQGFPDFIRKIENRFHTEIAESLNLNPSYLDRDYPIEVVSTGLPYLLVPVKQCIGDVKIKKEKFEEFLSQFGAKFTYVFDTGTLECRTWDNYGNFEDVATGSAAGPLCAYLVRNGFKSYDEIITISQGRFLKRPSLMKGHVDKKTGQVFIQGNVVFFCHGEINIKFK